MLPEQEKAYMMALVALQKKNYAAASGYFKTAENLVADNAEIRILSEANEILLAVREEIAETEV
jgi:hypothetical protein